MSFFPGHFESTKCLKNYEIYFSGNYFRNNFVSEGKFPLGHLDVEHQPIGNLNVGPYFGDSSLNPMLEHKLAIIRPPYKIQNPSEPQNTPRNTPEIPLQNRNTEKYEKIRKSPNFGDFRIFFLFFLYFGFGGGFRVYFGVYFGVRRGFVFCMGDV